MTESHAFEIRDALPEDMDAVRRLFTAYQEWLNDDICFAGFNTELQNLPGDYTAPTGALLVIERKNRLVACAGLRACGSGNVELKRLYVEPESQGMGVGKRLLETVLERARFLQYKQLLLETLPVMESAIGLYKSAGFIEIENYSEIERAGVRFFSLELGML